MWPSDLGGCGYYRLVWPAEALARQGYDVHFEHGPNAGPLCHWDRPWPGRTDAPVDAHVIGCEPYPADVVVLQRPFRRQWAELIPHLQTQGIAVVVDVDDDFTPGVVPQDNAVWRDIDGTNPHHSWRWHRQALLLADLVTVSTPALAKRFPGSILLRNRLPTIYFDDQPARPHDPPRVGWCGQVATHPGDLEVTGGAVQQVIDRSGAQFHQVGNPAGVAKRLGLRAPPTSARYAPFGRLFRALTRFDIGIVPLNLTAFNAAKSYLKGLEYAAAALPFVASPTPEYQVLHRQGVGVLARHPDDWRRELLALVRSPDLRADQAGRNRAVAERHTYDEHADEWWAAWALARAAIRRAAA